MFCPIRKAALVGAAAAAATLALVWASRRAPKDDDALASAVEAAAAEQHSCVPPGFALPTGGEPDEPLRVLCFGDSNTWPL